MICWQTVTHQTLDGLWGEEEVSNGNSYKLFNEESIMVSKGLIDIHRGQLPQQHLS